MPATQDIQWTNCRSLRDVFVYPGSPPRAQQDPTWDPPLPFVTYVWLLMIECERVSWGPFERPMRMVLEYHNDAQPPDSCSPPPGQPTNGAMLAGLWVNDPAFADYVKANYDGIAVYYSDIQNNVSTQGLASTFEWSWGPADGPRTVVRDVDERANAAPDFTENYRLYFFNATRGAVLDLHLNSPLSPPYTDRLDYGEIHQPMLAADFSEQYVATGRWDESATMTGTLTFYKDHKCTPR